MRASVCRGAGDRPPALVKYLMLVMIIAIVCNAGHDHCNYSWVISSGN